MSIDWKPIPAFYCCYLLRSTKRRSALYVGSTPNPRRRLAQHNGKSKGGAVRTARENLRPWEMTCVVSGFPSNVAALQFEWAWQNSHKTRRIAEEQRTTATVRVSPKTGRSRRTPRPSLTDRLSNLHLLLRVPSFARWPLQVQFFSPDAHELWVRWSDRVYGKIRSGINIFLDLEKPLELAPNEDVPPSTQPQEKNQTSVGNGGLKGVDVGYSRLKAQVEKGLFLLADGEKNTCAVCDKDVESKTAMVLVCPIEECNGSFHLTCLARRFLHEEEKTFLLPTSGTCPQCGLRLEWIDLVKELSLRLRGGEQVARLMEKPKVRKRKVSHTGEDPTQALHENSVNNVNNLDHDQSDTDHDSSTGSGLEGPLADDWRYQHEDDDMMSVTSTASGISSCFGAPSPTQQRGSTPSLGILVEDSEWDDAEVLD